MSCGRETYLCISDVGFLLEFLRFLKKENLLDKDVLMRAEVSLENMQSNLRARRGFHKAKFQDKDSEVHFTDQDLQNFFHSTKVKAAKKALHRGPEGLTIRDIINVRNYLLTVWMVENCCRPAALYAVSVADIQKARRTPRHSEKNQTTYFVVPSFYDKTVAVTGLPNYLVLSEPLMKDVLRYMDVLRPVIAGRNPTAPDDLFLLEDGTRMGDAAISAGYR